MKIGEIIKERGSSLSFEFFPPKDEAGEARLFQNILNWRLWRRLLSR